MKLSWLGLWFALVLTSLAPAQQPIVPGFERFHASEPVGAGGRLLLGELNCTKCHAHPGVDPKGAPILDGVGARLQARWIRDYLMNPRQTHPGTTMPDVLGNGNRAARVEALVHFLVSQKGGAELPRLEKNSSANTGGILFNRIGCAACHADPLTTEFAAEHAAAGLVSLENLPAKYSHVALAEFLHAPLARRPGGRMPGLRLTLREASDIAAYVLDTLGEVENSERAPLVPFEVDEEQAASGGKLFASVGCANCHQLGQRKATLAAPDLVALQGDADADPCPRADYALSRAQRTAIAGVLARPIPKLDAAGRVRHTLAAHHCHACHRRDGIGGAAASRQPFFTGDDALGDEGKIPPPLTGVGRKLRSGWLARVLAGETSTRPYMHTRMPDFGIQNVGHLAADFGPVDGAPDFAPESAFADGDPEAGRALMGTEGGVGCITCHGVGEREGLALKALSLNDATRRYRPDWFKLNLIDPLKTRPGTLMPSFWPDGVAGNKAILGGDTDKQIAAIWRYLDDPDQDEPLPPGFPDIDERQYEMVPADRPVVQRAMMDGAGTQAIAVGFPEGVHFAFDADRCRLAIVWKGRFLDAYHAWFSRMKPTAEPLGHEVRFMESKTAGKRLRFKGYTLDKAGVPTFRYTDGATEILDRIAPNGEGGFTRSVVRGPETETTSISW